MQPGWNWRVHAPPAPNSSETVAPSHWQAPNIAAPPLRFAPGLTPQPQRGRSGNPANPNGYVADTGTGGPRELDWWQASQTAASPVTTLQQRAPDQMPAAYIPIKWPGRAAQIGRQWNTGNTGNASMTSHGFPSTWYNLRLPVAYIPAARAIWRSIRTFTQGTRSNDRQYIPAVFVPASPVNTLGVNHSP